MSPLKPYATLIIVIVILFYACISLVQPASQSTASPTRSIPPTQVESAATPAEFAPPPITSTQFTTSSIIEGCPLFPANNVWNARIDKLPIDPRSDDYVDSIGPDTGLHPDFGTVWEGSPNGIPYNTVPGDQPLVPITFEYDDESDPGPYPIPPNPLIEGGPDSNGDRHVLVLDRDNCILYEVFYAYPQNDGSWQAGSGAIFDLRSNTLRPETWTSADAAGLPILPGLVRYDEVMSGAITHALRFTADRTRKEYIWPARHHASNLTDSNVPPMGQRFRLKASFDTYGFSPEVKVILNALKTFGMFLADNGSDWFISGVPDTRWNDETLVEELRRIKGSDFEAVDESSLMVHRDSGEVAVEMGNIHLWIPLVMNLRPPVISNSITNSR